MTSDATLYGYYPPPFKHEATCATCAHLVMGEPGAYGTCSALYSHNYAHDVHALGSCPEYAMKGCGCRYCKGEAK